MSAAPMSPDRASIEIVLASGSASRARMLADAGVPHVRDPADIDEAALKRRLAGDPTEAVALELARAKAAAVAGRRPAAIVIGADQMLELGSERLDKPIDLAAARRQLAALRGREHRLVTAAVAVRGDDVLWRHVEVPRLRMRSVTDGFLDRYLAEVGEAATASVGAYQLEGRGAQLFERIEGDFFAILGLPLLPLLAFLREAGALPS